MLLYNWFLFKKAGYEGWKALIPFYNSWIMAEFSMGNGVYMILAFDKSQYIGATPNFWE